MRIAVVSTFFMPGSGYQEENIARNLVMLGHEVKVFTSTYYSPTSKYNRQGSFKVGITSSREGYSIERIYGFFNWGSVVLSKGLKRKIKHYDPETVMIIGVGTLFPFTITGNNSRFKRIVFFGNNIDMVKRKKKFGLRNILKQKLVNRLLYNRAVKYCEHLVLYTPSTKMMLEKIINKKQYHALNDKKIASSLGFDSSVFRFKDGARKDLREKHQIKEEDLVFITSTKVQSGKMIEDMVQALDQLMQKGHNVYYILIGFLNDAYGQRIKEKIRKSQVPDRFICLPFLGQHEINAYYSVADVGIWLQAAISIQQAMATGLYVCLQNRSSVNHLIVEKNNGKFISADHLLQDLEKVCQELTNEGQKNITKRLERIELNRKFNYKDILTGILQQVEHRIRINKALAQKQHPLLFQRIVPHYRVPLFEKLYDEFGVVVLHSQEKKGESLRSENMPQYKSTLLPRFFVRRTPTAMFQWVLPPIKAHKPKIVISEFSLSYVSFWLLFFLRKYYKYKMIAWTHGIRSKEMLKPFSNWQSKIQLWVYNEMDAVILYSEKRRELISKRLRNPSKLFVASNTLNTRELDEVYHSFVQAGKQKIKDELGFTNKWNLVFIGRLLPDKRIDLLLDAFKRLPEDLDIGLHIIGDGPEEKLISQNKCTSIHYYGPIHDDSISSKYLFASDLMVMPGYVGLSVVHAMAMGCPVLTSKQGKKGPYHAPESEYIHDGINGWFAHYSVEGIKNAIVDLLKSPGKLNSMSKSARLTIEKEAGFENLVKGFTDALNYVSNEI